MNSVAQYSPKSTMYEKLARLGVNRRSLAQLDPTEDQLGQLLSRLTAIHNRKLARFIASLALA
ncbi:MAG: hypothetical protein ACREAQ_04365 [Nitrososphaera sp.]